MAKRHIELLQRWQREAPDLAAVDWREVCGAVTSSICRRYNVQPNQIFTRCSKTPQEFAQEIMEEYLLGNVPWKRGHQPTTASMIALLSVAVARDILDQCFCRQKGKRVARHEQSIDAPNPPPVCARPTIECDGYIDGLMIDLAKRPDPHPLFLDYIQLQLDHLKPAAIAHELGVPIEDIRNMQKRLKRRLKLLVPPEVLAGRSRGGRSPRRNRQVHHA